VRQLDYFIQIILGLSGLALIIGFEFHIATTDENVSQIKFN
jgi:hypothetical protein